MAPISELQIHDSTAFVWPVGALCRAVADALDLRFNPAAVRGEVSGFTRAASGHCYFTLKDAQGQIRCAMFRRAASLLDFTPADGQLVQARGRLSVYEARGELQLVVESLTRAGQGTLMEAFLQLRQRLHEEGLFAPERKRPIPAMPRAIGVVTSPQAAALHDVLSALQRRAPHVPVVVAPAPVQGSGAAEALVQALARVAAWVDVILLVRGGGSIEDLWAFCEEPLARAIVACPVPVISGVGHETDFTIADFCADLRAPTPTAAAELAARPRADWLSDLDRLGLQMRRAIGHRLDVAGQKLDAAAARLGRPSQRLAGQRLHLQQLRARLEAGRLAAVQRRRQDIARWSDRWRLGVRCGLATHQQLLERVEWRLHAASPRRVLERGYALLSTAEGRPLTRADQIAIGQPVRATLADGEVDLTVLRSRPVQFLQSAGVTTHRPTHEPEE